MIFNAYQDTDKGIAGVSVVSGGHIFARRGRMIDRPHGRGDYLLFYVAKGKELFYLEKEVLAQEGTFIAFKPFEAQKHVYVGDETGELYYIHFNAPSDFDCFGFKSSAVYNAGASSKVRDLFEEIISELHEKQPAYEKICTAKLFNLFALLERKTKKETSPHGRYYDRISLVLRAMNIDYHTDCTLDEYAEMCSMSKFHFLRIFKEVTGYAPLEYKNRIRLDHAKELLKDTTLLVSEIGRLTGYVSGAYFCDAFKRKVGMTPTAYRKQSNKTV